MKREILFICSMMVLGAVLGVTFAAGIASLSAIRDFGYNPPSHIITLEEKEDLEQMNRLSKWFRKLERPIILITGKLLLFGITLSLLLLNLNPNLGKKSTLNKKGITKALLVIISAIALLILIDYADSQKLVSIAIFLIGTGFLWFIAGETGWAGDFLSWKMGVQGREAKPLMAFFMGGVVGSAVIGLLFLNSWILSNYSMLLLEMPEVYVYKYLHFKFLVYGFVFMLSLSFGIIAGLIVALSPTYQEIRQRFLRLFFPAVLFVILVVTISGVYFYYGLGKRFS